MENEEKQSLVGSTPGSYRNYLLYVKYVDLIKGFHIILQKKKFLNNPIMEILSLFYARFFRVTFIPAFAFSSFTHKLSGLGLFPPHYLSSQICIQRPSPLGLQNNARCRQVVVGQR